MRVLNKDDQNRTIRINTIQQLSVVDIITFTTFMNGQDSKKNSCHKLFDIQQDQNDVFAICETMFR